MVPIIQYRMIIKILNSTLHIRQIFFPSSLIRSRKQPIGVIFNQGCQAWKKGWKYSNKPRVIGTTTIYKVFPNENPKPITVIIPPRGSSFACFLSMLKSKIFYHHNVVNHRFVRGGVYELYGQYPWSNNVYLTGSSSLLSVTAVVATFISYNNN